MTAAAAAHAERTQDASAIAARQEALRWAGLLATPDDAPRFARLLDSGVVWQEALNALMQLPQGAGARVVTDRVSSESETDKAMEYIRVLGQFQVLEAKGALTALAKNTENGAMGWAALDALAQMGVQPAEVVKRPLTTSPEEAARYAAAGLRAAQELLDHGQTKKAESLFRTYSDASGTYFQIRAAMCGLLAAGSPEAARVALGYLNTPRLREAATHILIASQVPGTDEILDKAFKVGDSSMQAGLLEVFLGRGGDANRQKVEAARAGASPELRVTAARLLGEAPSDGDLIAVASEGSPWVRAEAVDAFLDMANARLLAGDHAAAAAQYRAVLQHHMGAEVERTALEGLGQCGEYDDNELISPFMQDPDTGAAAYAVKARLALKLPNREDQVKELQAVAEVSPYEEGIFAAANLLAGLGVPVETYAKKRGYLTGWIAMGPFPNEGGATIGTNYLTPERADAIQNLTWKGKNYVWEAAHTPSAPPVVELKSVYKDAEQSVAYVFAKFAVTKATAAELQLGVGGAFEVWLDGKLIERDPTPHTWRADEVRMPVTLNAGVNKVLVKVVQSTEDWRCSLRVADRRGRPLDLSAQPAAKDGSEGVGINVNRAANAVKKAVP